MATPGIVFADMDGTFLGSDKSVPEANLRMLDALLERRIPFVPCTGRPAKAVPQVCASHPATTHIVASNGAVIQDVDGARLRVLSLSPEIVCDLYERVRGIRCTFDLFCDGEVYSERARYDSMGTLGLRAPMLAMLRQVRTPTDLMVPELAYRARSIEKVTCFWKTEEDRDALVAALKATLGISYASGDPKDFEVQAAGASKGAALVWLCEHLGIDVADSVAFGDEGNDVTLVAAAGDGVAMGNASVAVRAVADHVTATCDEAGVAAYVERLLR